MMTAASPLKDAVARVKSLYYIMQSMEGKLGGGEGVEGLYGSITRSGMQKVLDCLTKSCGLDTSSHLVDVGAGLGRPLLHALVHPGVASGFGIEIDRIKCEKAAAFLRHSVRELQKRAGLAADAIPVPKVQCSSIEKVATLEPGTHAYSFWEGVPVEGKCAFGRLFASSRTMQSVAVVQRAMRGCDPADEMDEMGFGRVLLVSSFSVSMSGSGRSFTAYVFVRATPLPAQVPLCGEPSEMLPATPSAAEARRHSLESTDTTAAVPFVDVRDASAHAAIEETAVLKPADSPPGDPNSPVPATPAPHLRQPVARLATPGTAARLKELSHLAGSPAKALTPSGISGVPLRVPVVIAAKEQSPRRRTRLAESRAQNLRAVIAAGNCTGKPDGAAHANLGAQPAIQAQAAVQNPASGKASAVQKRAAKAKPKASPKKGVQKTQSPRKTLEAAGFRSKRGAAMAASKTIKGLDFDAQPQVIKAHGLGNLRPETTAR